MVDRTDRKPTRENMDRVARIYHAGGGEKEAGEYEDVPGFCTYTALEEIRKHGHVLTRGRYVGGAREGRWRAVRGENETPDRAVAGAGG